MADEQKPFDPETATLEELRAVALQEENAVVDEQPRDDKGRFVPKDEEPPAPTTFRREIDLGDGGGVQVFEGDSMEALLDKLTDAQRNATRKIRELSAQKQPDPAPEPTFSDDEEWVLGQELLTKPSEAFGKLFERMVGKPLDAFKSDMARLNAFERAQAEYQASTNFVQKHPEFHQTPANGERMERYLEVYKLPPTVENLEKAFQELSKSGLLEAKPEVPPSDGSGAPTTEPARIVPSADDVPPARRAASGLSARRNAPVNRSTEPTEEEAENMPLEKLRELAQRSLRSDG